MRGRSSLMTEAPSLMGRPPKRRFTVASTGSSGPRFARFPWASAGRGAVASAAARPDAPSQASARSSARCVIDASMVDGPPVRGSHCTASRCARRGNAAIAGNGLVLDNEPAMKLVIDNRPVECAAGATVLAAVNRLGIDLPQLCKDPDRAPLGACRTCLVHVEGMRGTPAACHLPAREGMVVSTAHPDAQRVRSAVLDLTRSMLSEGEGRGDFGQVGAAVVHHALAAPRFAPLHRFAPDPSKSFFVLDREACILCGRCTTACDDVQRIGAISMLGRGHAMKVGVAGDALMSTSVCTSCGQCVATCPTGALRPKEAPAPVARRVETTCPYCGVGCGIEVAVRDDRRLAVMADDVPRNHASGGMLCVKGRFGTGFVHARDRVLRPMIRRDGAWRETSWDEALDVAADGLARHRGRFAALASAKATNEDGYLIQKLCRVVIGTNSVDHCTRLCHAPSVEAMLASMGSGATSNSYVDYEEAGCLMIVGADASANHPVIAVRFRRAMSRGARIVVVNPKRVELCD